MKKLVKESDMNDKEFLACIGHVCKTCNICVAYKAAPLKPVVSLPLANKFNQVVCLDLKEYVHNKVWILHMIDAATRYSQARLITTKRKEEISKQIFEMWISFFGVPSTLMSDNGGEFVNNLYTEVSQKLGIRMVMPPAESPFSNGIVERHNKVIYETMMKTKDDAKCEPEIALAWACSAKNALQNHNGYSPNQLVFGHNVNVPTVLTDSFPVLATTTSNEIVRKNLQALHDARKNYIKSVNSNRIKRALRHKTRTYSDESFEPRDRVYFKRNGHKGWLGLVVKLGGSIYKCHRCHVMKQNAVGASEQQRSEVKSMSRKDIPDQQILFEDDSSSDSDANDNVEEAVEELNVDNIPEIENEQPDLDNLADEAFVADMPDLESSDVDEHQANDDAEQLANAAPEVVEDEQVVHDDFEEQMRNLLGADLEAMRQGDANDLPVEGVVEDELEAEQEDNQTNAEINDDMTREPNTQTTLGCAYSKNL